MKSNIKISRRNDLTGVLPALRDLLDTCYPKPPRDVFYRLIEQYRIGFPVYIAVEENEKIVGFTYLAPNSKGGTLESLAVHPDFRGLQIGSNLVRRLIGENRGVIQITTRIPEFFEKLEFKSITQLPDNSYFMIYLNF
ncbi:GNAT family N-acetyltransferase [Baaleninema simplex]|uniref:GNAT family N-acetyltransferase n=1 Tax=Baaleninema simplex TaxID=2862350 RepID=UPI000347023F|nr:GNAT family N-acetyltransferase [Baaleninema simplex]